MAGVPRLATPEVAGALERLILAPGSQARALLAPHLERVRAAAREIEEGHARERPRAWRRKPAAAGDEVARGNFGQAVTRLETLEGKFPESSEAVKRALAAARAAAKAELERVGKNGQALARAGDFVQAALRLETFPRACPGTSRPRRRRGWPP